MQNEFNVVLNSFHSVSIVLPHIGDIQLPAKQDVQLLHVDIDTINYLRNSFSTSGVKVTLNKKSDRPYTIIDFKIPAETAKEKLEKEIPKEIPHQSPFEKVANYELPSGKHKGKKIKDLDVDTLKLIAKMTKNQAVKSAIEAFLMLK